MRPIDRLLRRGIPKTAIRKGLEDWSDRLSWWERVWTAIVVLGLGFEIAANLARFTPHNIFDLIWPHSRLLADIGSAMVFSGVFGELVVASKSGRVETALREENDRLIQEANERAAEAKLEYLRLLKQLVARNIPDPDIDAIAARLAKFAPQALSIFMYPVNAEKAIFASAINRALTKAGWIVQVSHANPPQPPNVLGDGFIAGCTNDDASADAVIGLIREIAPFSGRGGAAIPRTLAGSPRIELIILESAKPVTPPQA